MTTPDYMASVNVSALGMAENVTVVKATDVPVTTLSTFTNSTIIEVVTTAAASDTDGTITAVIIVLILLTLVILGFLLYRYMCHNKGAYRTTGELAPGEDPDEDHNGQALSEKTEYFI